MVQGDDHKYDIHFHDYIIQFLKNLLKLSIKIKIEISDFYCQECVKVETATDKLDHGIRYIFLFFLPFTLTIFPTLYIYILLIRHAQNYITLQV